ncbi:MAG: prepilin-type N-terminal cleavage/methylation domain-containing protein [Candidatus Saccharimonadales bacterium]
MKETRMKKHNQKGFGAVEILVVISVLLLIGGAVWFVLNNKKDPKDSSGDKQIRNGVPVER